MKQKKLWLLAVLCTCILAMWIMQVQAEITQSSGVLDGVSIVIDPGHGGKDDGARSAEAKEQEINLAIALKLKAELEQQGAQVTLTRDGAYDLASEGAVNRKREDMKKRVAMINEEPNDLFISIHLNAYPNVSIHGAHTFYRKGDEASRAFADILQKKLNALSGDEKSSKVGDYYILNETTRPGVLVECGFLSNAGDRAKLMQEEYQQRLATVLCEGVMEYLSILS